jgi:hypothetical protein
MLGVRLLHILHPALQLGEAKVHMLVLLKALLMAGTGEGYSLQAVQTLLVAAYCIGQVFEGLPGNCIGVSGSRLRLSITIGLWRRNVVLILGNENKRSLRVCGFHTRGR